MELDSQGILAEATFKAVRSSGSGGQHVNKVSSKVEATFNLVESTALTDEQKELLKTNLTNRLTKSGSLVLQCGESRSQYKNKALVSDRLLKLIANGLKRQKPRVATKMPKSVIRKRLKDKRYQSDKKANRKPPQV